MENNLKTSSSNESTWLNHQQVTEPDSEVQPLGPYKRVELWSGRFAMVGFTATVAAIALGATT